MADRYFSETPIVMGPAVLAGPEAHHLIHVMRAAHGTRVVLFDGSGAEFSAVVERVGRAEIELTVLAREEVNRELPFPLTLGVALPKGDRQKWLVEKAVELGVTRVIPLRTGRGVAQPVEQALMRLRRTVVEASKQCGRNRLMEITEPQSWPDFVEDGRSVPCRLLAHPKGSHAISQLRPYFVSCRKESGSPSDDRCDTSDENARQNDASETPEEEGLDEVWLALGPEGGFSPSELALAVAAGWHTVDLGPRILRVETAALMLTAIVTQTALTEPRVQGLETTDERG